MKKMLLAFAVMAFAAAAQAITLKWATDSANGWVSASLNCSFIYAGDATPASMATAIDVALGNSEAYDTVGTVWAANPSAYNTGSVISTVAQYTTGVYYIIFTTQDGKYAATSFDAADAVTSWIPDAGPIENSSYTGPVKVADFKGTLVPVPEPTALALLALGVAGLALRRRA